MEKITDVLKYLAYSGKILTNYTSIQLKNYRWNSSLSKAEKVPGLTVITKKLWNRKSTFRLKL